MKGRRLAARLAEAGFPDPDSDARELMAGAGGDDELLQGWLERRLQGEPIAWLTGSVIFVGQRVLVDQGVYVPRPQTEPLVRRAVDLLPTGGLAVDLATGSGAIAVVLRAARPSARVVATDIDERSCACAADNGVEVYQGDLAGPLPAGLAGGVDVVTAVVPYVPRDAMQYLPRDVLNHEPRLALDGGEGGISVLARLVRSSAGLLRDGGWLIAELGADQDRMLRPVIAEAGFVLEDRFVDEDGDLRGVGLRRIPRAQGVP